MSTHCEKSVSDDLDDRLWRWGLWAYRQQTGSLGYPSESCLVRIENYGCLVGPIIYEQSLPPPKSDASATDSVIQQLQEEDRAALSAHYVWRRHNGHHLPVKEKIKQLGMSRATYYRTVSEAKRKLRYLLDE